MGFGFLINHTDSNYLSIQCVLYVDSSLERHVFSKNNFITPWWDLKNNAKYNRGSFCLLRLKIIIKSGKNVSATKYRMRNVVYFRVGFHQIDSVLYIHDFHFYCWRCCDIFFPLRSFNLSAISNDKSLLHD